MSWVNEGPIGEWWKEELWALPDVGSSPGPASPQSAALAPLPTFFLALNALVCEVEILIFIELL